MIFRVGIDAGNPSLRITAECVNQLFLSESNTFILIQVSTYEKVMKVFSSRKGKEWSELRYNNYCSDSTIDLTPDGERWEGPSLSGIPFGFGTIYDEYNRLIYRGYVYNYKRVCYGTFYYGDLGSVEYEGNICQDLRHGFGTYYSRCGKCIYSGKWLNDNPVVDYCVSTPSYCENLLIVNSLVEEITVGTDSYNSCELHEFVLADYKYLKKLHISNNCFTHFRKFVVHGLPQLEQLSIGSNCFCGNNNGLCVLSESPLLSEISIKECSFQFYSKFTILDLPSLLTLSIQSECFQSANFSLNNFPSLSRITLGDSTFQYSTNIAIQNLPNLVSLVLGEDSLSGGIDVLNSSSNDTLPNSHLILQNLPKLVEIDSVGGSFQYVKDVTIEYLPSLQRVNLPCGFNSVIHREIIDCPFLEHHSRLKYDQMTEIGLLTRSMEVLVLCDSCCNDPHITELNLVNYPHLSLIDIGNNCFEHVTRVHLQQLPKLDSFSVGWKCFYHINTNGEFLMSDCDRLLQIHIGLWSFNEYSLFSIENLPCLTNLTMMGLNFLNCSLQLRALPQLESLHLGVSCFYKSRYTVIEHLPCLHEIQLQINALAGSEEEDCSLVLRNLPSLTRIRSRGFGFVNPRFVVFEDIPNLQMVILEDYHIKMGVEIKSFQLVQNSHIHS